jgi:hypothetical protein
MLNGCAKRKEKKIGFKSGYRYGGSFDTAFPLRYTVESGLLTQGL